MERLPLEGKLKTKSTDEVAYEQVFEAKHLIRRCAPPSPQGEGFWREPPSWREVPTKSTDEVAYEQVFEAKHLNPALRATFPSRGRLLERASLLEGGADEGGGRRFT